MANTPMTKVTQAELLPCRFCGETDGLTVAQTVADALMWWSVECHGCCVSLSGDASETEAIAAWNMRHQPPSYHQGAADERERAISAALAIVEHFESVIIRPSTGELDPPLSDDDAVCVPVGHLRVLRCAIRNGDTTPARTTCLNCGPSCPGCDPA